MAVLQRVAGLLLKTSVGLLILCLFLLVASQVIDRHITRLWFIYSAEEHVKVVLPWLTFVGLAAAMQSGETVRVDMVREALPRSVRLIVEIAFDLAMLTVIGVVLWNGARVFEVSQYQQVLGTDVSLAMPVAGLLTGFAACFIIVVFRLGRSIRAGF